MKKKSNKEKTKKLKNEKRRHLTITYNCNETFFATVYNERKIYTKNRIFKYM